MSEINHERATTTPPIAARREWAVIRVSGITVAQGYRCSCGVLGCMCDQRPGGAAVTASTTAELIAQLCRAVEDRDDARERYATSPYASNPRSVGALFIAGQVERAEADVEAAIQRLIGGQA